MEQTTVLEDSEIQSTEVVKDTETGGNQTGEDKQTTDNRIIKARSFGQIAAGLTAPGQIELRWLNLEEIEAVDEVNDSRVEQVREASSTYLRQLPEECLTVAGLKILSCCLPVHVVHKKKGFKKPVIYTCVGGLRLFRLLKKKLEPADKVMALIHRDNDEEIKLLATIDLLIVPALLGLHHKDRRPLAAAWDKAQELGFQAMLTRRQHHALNQLLGCDIRVVKKPVSQDEADLA